MDGLVWIFFAIALFFPLAFIVYVNIGSSYRAIKDSLSTNESVRHRRISKDLVMIDA